MKTALIMGGGISGCSAAHELERLGGWDVTLVDAAPFLGGGCKTHYHGGHPHTNGPRLLITTDEKIYNYLDKHCPLRRCKGNKFITYIEQDQQFYNYPIHEDDLDKMPEYKQITRELEEVKTLQGAQHAKNFEEFWISSIGPTLYEKFINKYSKKMWQVEDNTIMKDFSWSPKGVALLSGDEECWENEFSAYPYAFNGYDDYFDIATANATVLLSTRIVKYDILNKTVFINGERKTYDIIINTISPDYLFELCHGELPYIGRDLIKIVLPIEHATPKDVFFLYYAGEESFTRVVEYKKLTQHKSPTTLIGLEIPSTNGKYYPLPIPSAIALAKKYHDELPDGVFSIGRAGSYQYRIDMDDSIDQAWDVCRGL